MQWVEKRKCTLKIRNWSIKRATEWSWSQTRDHIKVEFISNACILRERRRYASWFRQDEFKMLNAWRAAQRSQKINCRSRRKIERSTCPKRKWIVEALWRFEKQQNRARGITALS